MNIKLKLFLLSVLITLSGLSFAIDTDRDGMPDNWEIANGRNPLIADYQISVGYKNSCALDDNGVICWGTELASVPTLDSPSHISVYHEGACAIDATGVVCWPEDHPNGLAYYKPQIKNPSQISVGRSHACAIDDGSVVCWGEDYEPGKTNVPVLNNPIQISAGDYHTCAIDEIIESSTPKVMRTVVCWGQEPFFYPPANGITTPPNLTNPTQISVQRDNTCVLDDSGVICWGADNNGRTDVPSLNNPNYVDMGGVKACAIDDSDVICWGELGKDEFGRTINPYLASVPPLINPFQISAGAIHNCALDDTGVVCWGGGEFPNDPNRPNIFIDYDRDGVTNAMDAFPLDSSETLDGDSDGTGDNSDAFPNNALYTEDSDSDGMPDAWETSYGLSPNDASDAASDHDNDGISAYDEFIAGTIPAGSLDIDGNGQYDALTDGLLLLRGMFGLTGTALLDGAVASDALYVSGEEIKGRIDMLGDLIDIDGNGTNDALTDGLVILRYLFGLRGDVLVDGVIASDALIQSAEGVGEKIDSLMPVI